MFLKEWIASLESHTQSQLSLSKVVLPSPEMEPWYFSTVVTYQKGTFRHPHTALYVLLQCAPLYDPLLRPQDILGKIGAIL